MNTITLTDCYNSHSSKCPCVYVPKCATFWPSLLQQWHVRCQSWLTWLPYFGLVPSSHPQDLANLVDILVCGNLSTDIRRSTAEQLSALARRRRFADAMGDTRLLESLLSQLLASTSTDANYAQAQLAAAYLTLLDCMIKVWRQEPLLPRYQYSSVLRIPNVHK